MSHPSPYQSPTRRLPAEVRLESGSRLTGDIHLHPNTLAPGGYDSALKLLNAGDDFFPLSTPGAGVVLVGKRHVVSVTYEAHAAPSVPADDHVPRLELELLLSDGRSLTGAALVETPSAYPRALDIVNRARTFLPIRDGDRVHLVHRAHIRTIHPGD